VELKEANRALWSASKSGNFNCAAHKARRGAILKHSFIGWLALKSIFSLNAE